MRWATPHCNLARLPLRLVSEQVQLRFPCFVVCFVFLPGTRYLYYNRDAYSADVVPYLLVSV